MKLIFECKNIFHEFAALTREIFFPREFFFSENFKRVF